MLFYYIFTGCVIPDVLNYRTHVKTTKGCVLLYPEITPYYTLIIMVVKPVPYLFQKKGLRLQFLQYD